MNIQLSDENAGAKNDEAKSASPKKSPDSNSKKEAVEFWIRNQTPQRLQITFKRENNVDQVLRFPPLAGLDLISESDLEEKAFRAAFKFLEFQGFLSHKVLTKSEKANLEGIGTSIFTVLFLYFIFSNLLIEDYPFLRILLWVGIPVLVLIFGIAYIFLKGLGWTTFQRILQQVFTLFLVLTTGSALTATVIYFFGDGQDLIAQEPSLALLGRVLQFTFIVVASLFPVLLYFLFDRSRLETLRLRFEHQIFRFDPNVQSLSDVYAKYGSKLDEIYGRDALTARGRIVPGTRWPIWLCTLVITVGWLLTLLPVGTSPEIRTASDLLLYFVPVSSTIAFGFLGAYYFAINSVSRRYTRGDLQPKAYSHIVTRILVVVIFAWVVETLLGANPYVFGLMFLIGVIPETFWTIFNEFIRNQLLGRIIHSLKEKDPLTNIEGIDPYDRARLAEEGVTNIESLAHHDMIDLILATHIPVYRLVDWLDQAILYLHLSQNWNPKLSDPKKEISEPKGEKKRNGANTESKSLKPLEIMKTYGIRTATDFIRAYKTADEEKRLKYLLRIFGDPVNDTQEERLSHVQVLYDTLGDDEWLKNIEYWRNSTSVSEVKIVVDIDGKIVNIEPQKEDNAVSA